MPIASKAPSPKYMTPPVDRVQETQPYAVPRKYRGNFIDTRWHTTTDIITHISGSPWTVYYFSQVVGADDELTPPQIDQSGALQQYIQIKELELRVTEPLSTSQNPETNDMTLVGGANTFPFFIPNVNDVFFADIGNGMEGAFLITNVERKTILSETTHHIEYMLMGNTDYSQLKDNILKKVVKTYHFDKMFLQRGKNPLLVAEDYGTLSELKRQFALLLDVYLHEFYNHELRTIVLPTSANYVYDHLLVEFIRNITDVNQHRILRNLSSFNVDDGYALNDSTVWDLLLRMDAGRFYTLSKRMWAVSSRAFEHYPLLRGIYHSRIHLVLYPHGKVPYVYGNCATGGVSPYPLLPIDIGDEIRYGILDGLGDFIPHPTGIMTEDRLATPPLIHPVNKDDHYVLSKAFYEDWIVGQSQLELLVHRAINRESFDSGILLDICKDIRHWTPLDRFYYIPVLLPLIKIQIQRM